MPDVPVKQESADFEFLDTSRRGPERRELAVQLGAYFELTPVRRPHWTERTVETGHELVDGRLRATSETTEHLEMRPGTGAPIWSCVATSSSSPASPTCCPTPWT